MISADEWYEFRRSHAPGFYIPMPSADLEHWYTCEIHSRDKPVFFGSKEDAEAVAAALNSREQARYVQSSDEFVSDHWKQEAERDRAAWRAQLDNWIAFQEERLRKEEELGFANTVCLTVLSLPG